MDFDLFLTIFDQKLIKRSNEMTLMSIDRSKWSNLIEKDDLYRKVDLFRPFSNKFCLNQLDFEKCFNQFHCDD